MSRKELRDNWIEKLKKGIYLLYPFADITVEYDGYNIIVIEVEFYYKGERLRLQRRIFEPSLIEYGEEIVEIEILAIQKIITERILREEVKRNDTSRKES